MPVKLFPRDNYGAMISRIVCLLPVLITRLPFKTGWWIREAAPWSLSQKEPNRKWANLIVLIAIIHWMRATALVTPLEKLPFKKQLNAERYKSAELCLNFSLL